MFDTISRFIDKINEIIWGTPTILLLIGCGIFMTVLLRFFQVTKIKLWLDNTLFAIFKQKDVRKKDDGKSINQFQAISTALASTIGTGNIAGVATAISTGGPGAIFWMWVSACFGMMTSYSENVLGIFYRKKNSDGEWCGGPMYYINDGLSQKKHLKKLAKPLSVFFALLLIGATFGIGNMTQANSISDSLKGTLSVSVYVTAAVLMLLTFLIISGGVKRIAGVTEKLVPFMALFYILATLFIIISNSHDIPHVFSSIFKNAFSFKAVFGATGGIAIKKCVSMGFRRGIFSNEAGLGASVTVNASSNIKEPAKQGMWGIFGVFVDTIIVCSMTAFVLLSTHVEALPLEKALDNVSSKVQYVYIGEEDGFEGGKVRLTDINPNRILVTNKEGKTYTLNKDDEIIEVNLSRSDEYSYANVMALKGIYNKRGNLTNIALDKVDGVSLMTLAFNERFGKVASIMLAVSVVLFAFSTIIGWSFYGAKATEYLFGKKSVKFFKVAFVIFTFIGAIAKLNVVWGISDALNGLMALPNLIALFALSGTVVKITNNYLSRKNGEKIKPMLSAHADIQKETEEKLDEE